MGAGASAAAVDTSALLDQGALQASRDAIDASDLDAATASLRELVASVEVENASLLDYIARRDAVTLHEATAGLGTDEAAMTAVICGRTKKHLEALDAHYREAHGKTLIELVKSECSGNLMRMLWCARARIAAGRGKAGEGAAPPSVSSRRDDDRRRSMTRLSPSLARSALFSSRLSRP